MLNNFKKNILIILKIICNLKEMNLSFIFKPRTVQNVQKFSLHCKLLTALTRTHDFAKAQF